MDELINKLMSQADLDEIAAKKVIEVVKGYLEDKLPSPIDKQVVNVIDGIEDDQIDSAINIAKGLFGK